MIEISTLEKINYRPSEPAKKILRELKRQYPKGTWNAWIDEAVIKTFNSLLDK